MNAALNALVALLCWQYGGGYDNGGGAGRWLEARAVVLDTSIAVMIPLRLNFRLAWRACSVDRRGAAYAAWGAANVALAVAAASQVMYGQPTAQPLLE